MNKLIALKFYLLTILLLLFFTEKNGQVMENKIKTFLMFEGKAVEAINLYTSLFENSGIIEISYYGKEEAGGEGSVKTALFTLNGKEYMAIDSPAKHEFTFTPSISLFVECDSPEELEKLFTSLSEEGKILMPPDNYGFSDRFTWVEDRFGVSWQINYGAK